MSRQRILHIHGVAQAIGGLVEVNLDVGVVRLERATDCHLAVYTSAIVVPWLGLVGL
jgi:hypothetical protein